MSAEQRLNLKHRQPSAFEAYQSKFGGTYGHTLCSARMYHFCVHRLQGQLDIALVFELHRNAPACVSKASYGAALWSPLRGSSLSAFMLAARSASHSHSPGLFLVVGVVMGCAWV